MVAPPRRPRPELAQAALHEARRLVARDGLAGLTARDLAQAVGCSVGTLYNLYPNLDTVRMHLNAELLDRLLAVVREADGAVGAGAGPEARLLAQARAYLGFARSNLNLYLALIDNRPPATDDPVPGWFLEKVAALRRTVEEALSPLFAPGEADALERAATMLWTSVNGLCEAAVSRNLTRVSTSDPDLLLEELVRTLVAGLRGRRRG